MGKPTWQSENCDSYSTWNTTNNNYHGEIKQFSIPAKFLWAVLITLNVWGLVIALLVRS
jgi:hypothetical protein